MKHIYGGIIVKAVFLAKKMLYLVFVDMLSKLITYVL